jgi:hypothetical protein
LRFNGVFESSNFPISKSCPRYSFDIITCAAWKKKPGVIVE